MFRKRTVGRLTHTLVTLVCILSMLLTSLPLLPAAPAYAQGVVGSTLAGQGQLTIAGPPGVWINPYNGNVHYSRVDLATSPGGYPFPAVQSELFHNSLESYEDRGFGKGWRFGYDIGYQKPNEQDVTILWPDGKETAFTYDSASGGFKPPRGVYDRLESLGNDAYRLTTLDGTVYYFDNMFHRRVTRMEAENGLALTFTYTSFAPGGYGPEYYRISTVTDSYGRSLRFTYNLYTGRAEKIYSDFLNRSLILAYDADGNLSQITDLAGQTTSYSYHVGVNSPLAQVTLPDGRAYNPLC
jgi:hypothetical protein